MVETPRAALTTNAVYRNARWAIRGLGGELLTNLAGRGGPPWTRVFRGRRAPEHGGGAVAVVTGATGGIGSEVASGLASAGYHVIVAARSRRRGQQLAQRLRAETNSSAEFIQLEIDNPASSVALARALGGRPCALLVNNAGVMSVGKAEIMQTNLIGPVVLTLALLPSLRAHKSPRVVNVGSSSHLRAGRVDPSMLTLAEKDADLSAYAQSKLGLMQFSNLLRSVHGEWLTVVDAHPGLVWTPMLQRHWGPLAPALDRTRLARVLFKTPACGAATILSAALDPRVPPADWGERSRWRRGWERGQPYFVNRRPGGFASKESRDMVLASEMWRTVCEPAARASVPIGCRELVEGLAI